MANENAKYLSDNDERLSNAAARDAHAKCRHGTVQSYASYLYQNMKALCVSGSMNIDNAGAALKPKYCQK